MKRILLIAASRDLRKRKISFAQKFPQCKNWCCLMLLDSFSRFERREKKFYCRHSSIIIKQFKIHDFGARIKHRRCKIVLTLREKTFRGPSQGVSQEIFDPRNLTLLVRWKNIIENAKSLILAALDSMRASSIALPSSPI